MNYELKVFYDDEELPQLDDVSFFHNNLIFDLYRDVPSHSPIMIVCFEKGVPLASLSAHIVRINKILNNSLFRRCYISQKPAYYKNNLPEEDIFHLLLNKLVDELKKKVLFIEFRHLCDPIFGYKAFRKNNFFSVKWINIKNSLQRKRKIWNQLSRSRKTQVNKAKRKGVTIEEIKSNDELLLFYKSIDKNISWKFSHRFPPYQYFENFFKIFVSHNKGKIFITKYQDKIIGGIIIGLHQSKYAYSLYYWGKTKTYKTFYPTIYAIWHAMNYAEKNGYLSFDFMDSGYIHERAGKPRFLLQFGGKQHATRRWYRISCSWANIIGKKIYN